MFGESFQSFNNDFTRFSNGSFSNKTIINHIKREILIPLMLKGIIFFLILDKKIRRDWDLFLDLRLYELTDL